MPELPEVTTTVNGLKKVLPGSTIVGVWTDLAKSNQKIKHFKDTIKDKKFFDYFKREISKSKIKNVERRAKNILIRLENNKTILIHLKMTGHLLYGKYIFDKKYNNWSPSAGEKKSLHDPYNRFIHVVFILSNDKHLAFCDSRKFGKVTLIETKESHRSKHLVNIGPEPLDDGFSFDNFCSRIMSKPRGKIKTVLMDQSIIAGIGNIYSDEILWEASVHPESISSKIDRSSLKMIYKYIKTILKKGIDFGGDSMSDYRDINGERGSFQNHHNVYRKNKELCGKKKCNGVIIRKVVNGRSAHFCNKHQKLFK